MWGLKFDLNMLHLQSKSAESVIWENRLIQGSKYASIYGVLFAHSLDEVEKQTKAVERLPSVSKVNSILSVMPADQDRKLLMLKELRPVLGDIRSIPMPSGPVDIDKLESAFSRIRFKMLDPGSAGGDGKGSLARQMREVRRLIDAVRKDFTTIRKPLLEVRLKSFELRMIEDLNDKLSLLWENIETEPLRPDDLPKPLYDRFVGPDNLYILRIFPTGNVWDPHVLDKFVFDLRSVDKDATGDPITLSVFTKAFRNACIMAAVYAVIFIVLILVVTLRSPVPIAAALAPLIWDALDAGPDARLRDRPEPCQYHIHAAGGGRGCGVRDHRRPSAGSRAATAPPSAADKHGYRGDSGRVVHDGRFLEPDNIDPPGNTQPGRAYNDRGPLRPCRRGAFPAALLHASANLSMRGRKRVPIKMRQRMRTSAPAVSRRNH